MAQNSVKFWNSVWRKEQDRYYPHFNSIIDFLPDHGRVIDVGCGNGTLLKLIKARKLGLKIEGRDHSFVAIKNLARFGIKGSVEVLPKINGKADIIIATEVLEHIKDDKAVVNSMSKAAKKIIVTVPNDRLGREECNEHERKYTVDSLGNLLGIYFKKYEVYDATGYLLAVAWS